jgi:hypothetical protein
LELQKISEKAINHIKHLQTDCQWLATENEALKLENGRVKQEKTDMKRGIELRQQTIERMAAEAEQLKQQSHTSAEALQKTIEQMKGSEKQNQQ